MPIYEYRCSDCGQIFEEWQKDFKEKEYSCPVCGGKAQRLISNTSFVLKGSGWYVTDYTNKRTPGGNGEKKTESSSTSTETSSSSKESKTASENTST